MALEIVVLYARVRREMRADDIRSVILALRGRPAAPPRIVKAADLRRAAELGNAVNRVLAHAPERSRCLVQSLVLTRMLARRHIESALIIGVATGGAFTAHAWVEADGVPLLPPLTSTFVPLVRL